VVECEGVGKPRGEMRVNEVVKMGVVQEVAEVANLRIGKKVIMLTMSNCVI